MQIGPQWKDGQRVHFQPPTSAYAEEMRKHEQHYGPFGEPGNPYAYREYPTMLYKAKSANPHNAEFESVQAHDDVERERYERQGFVYGGKAAAIEALQKQEREFAELAANRALTDRRMSEQAQAEAARVDESTVRHLPVIPEDKKRAQR